MRITSKMMADSAIRHMADNLETIQTLQEKIASEKAVQKLSDDPAIASASLTMHSVLSKIGSYLNTATVTDDWMTATEQSLGGMIDLATRANNLALSGLSDTMGAVERTSLATEMNELLTSAIQNANASHQEKYLFAGFQVRPTITPFVGADTNTDGYLDVVNYNGDAGVITQEVGPGQVITTNVQGPASFNQLFQGLIAARDALLANDTATLQTAADTIANATETVSTARTTNGARLRQMQNTLSRLETTEADVKALLSKKEDTNLAEAVSSLTHQQTVYQATIQVSQRAIATVTLFDYLK
jgi:flagellar hook-associated protein 3 FlgL